MEVGQGGVSGGKVPGVRTVTAGLSGVAGGRPNPPQIPLGRGTTVINRRGESDNTAQLTSSDSQLPSRPNDLFLRPSKDSLTHDANSLAPEALLEDVIVKEAYKETNSIVIRWESETTNILGFRVIYRLFGTPQFKQGPPLAPSEREFKIKNVPDNVSITVDCRHESLYWVVVRVGDTIFQLKG